MQNEKPLRIALTGYAGLIGSAAASFFSGKGCEVVPIIRRPDGSRDFANLDGTDVVIHLAGEGILGRWSPKKKERIRGSRVNGTQAVVKNFSTWKKPPKVFLCASAIGYYGEQGEKEVSENDSAGEGFFSDVCREWEKAAQEGSSKETRVVSLRIGVVMSPNGGMLKKMLTPAKFGLVGPLGSGKQYVSWISIDDVVGLFEHAIQNESIQGAFNVVAPCPVTNREMTKAVCKALRRPMAPALPAWFLRLLYGEIADDVLLRSTRVAPRKAIETGYRFHQPTLEEALQKII